MTPPFFSDKEIALLSDPSWFRLRARTLEHLEDSLLRLGEQLRMQVAGAGYLRPAEVDLGEGRLAKGDHLEDLPYIYLDLPRSLDEQSLFTFRTLFWWGHEISFSLLLSGPHLPEYRSRLMQNLGILEALDVHVSTAGSPWDWRRGPGHTLRISSGERGTLERLFRKQAFLKCSRYLEFHAAEFRQMRIDDAAILTFRALEPLILA
jgi:hypothetical protein